MNIDEITPEFFEKKVKMNWYRAGGIPLDDFKKGLLVTILKNKPAKRQEGGEIRDSDFVDKMMSHIENTRGGGIILKVVAVNLPYILLAVWDDVSMRFEEYPISKDLRESSFIKVNKDYAEGLGLKI